MLVTAAAISSVALLLGGLAQAPDVQARASADTITAEPGETLQCASARSALRKFMPKRAPKSVLRSLQADEARMCAMATELVENWDGSVSEQTRMVDEPLEIPNKWRAQQLAFVNDTRAKHGRKPLRKCARLDRAAQKYAQVMANTGHFAHTGPNGSSPTVRAKRAKYTGGVGENIAFGYDTNAQVMAGWIRSNGHYRNLLRPQYKDAGFGAALSKDGSIYWVQMFGLGGPCKVRR